MKEQAKDMLTRIWDKFMTITCPDCHFGIVTVDENGPGACICCLIIKKNKDNPAKIRWYDEVE